MRDPAALFGLPDQPFAEDHRPLSDVEKADLRFQIVSSHVDFPQRHRFYTESRVALEGHGILTVGGYLLVYYSICEVEDPGVP